MMHSSQTLFLPFSSIILVLLVLCSCDVLEKDTTEKTYSFSYQQDRQIVVDTTQEQWSEDSTRTLLNANMQPGNDLVFRYKYRETPPKNVLDGGFSEELLIQVPASSKQFKFTDYELKQAPIYYKRGCFCPRIGSLNADSGHISGQKINPNMWKINADVIVQNQYERRKVSFDDIFIRQK